MKCVICGHPSKKRRITDNLGHESIKDLCDDCVATQERNPNLNVETIDDGTEGNIMLPDEGTQL